MRTTLINNQSMPLIESLDDKYNKHLFLTDFVRKVKGFPDELYWQVGTDSRLQVLRNYRFLKRRLPSYDINLRMARNDFGEMFYIVVIEQIIRN